MGLRVMMVAGEPSGDLHGAGVVRELKRLHPAAEIFGVGGDRMRSEGLDVIFPIARLSFMGFVEVLKHLSVVRELQHVLTRALVDRQPAVVVLIDYPGFNLRFARTAKRHGAKVLYYISPQVWAWHRRRVKRMRGLIDRMNVVFPFEVEMYRREGINVEFVGHPLAEQLGVRCSREEFFRSNMLDPAAQLLGLFPGSRRQEIETIFPTMLNAARRLQASLGVQVAVGVAPNLSHDSVWSRVGSTDGLRFVENATYDLMAYSDVAIVTSGTATLETGWFGTPMMVVYKTSPATYFVGRLLVNVPYIGLVNIVAGEKVVPEFIQHKLTDTNLVEEATRQLTDEPYAAEMRRRLSVIKMRLGSPGASARVAHNILELGAVS